MVEGVRSELAAVAGLLEATEGGGDAHGRVRVDRDHAALDRTGRAQRLRAVPRPYRAREAVDGLVREPDRLLLIAERDHGRHRPEDLLARRPVVVVDRAEHRRREPESGAVRRAAAYGHRRAVRHERRHGLPLVLRYQRTHLRGLVERVPHPDGLDGLLEHLHEAVECRALDEDAGARAAVLAGVAEHGARRGGRRLLEVGVRVDHVRRLAAQLERYALDRPGGAGRDAAPDLGRAGKRDLRHVLVLHEPLPADRAGPGDHVHYSVGDAGLERDPLELDRGEWRELRRLEHDRVAGGERGRHLPGRDREREVPGRDKPDHAERLPEGHVHATRHGDRAPRHALGRARVIAEGLDHHAHLAASIRDRLSRVARLEPCELLEALLEGVRQPVQQRGAVRWRDGPPGRERSLRARDRGVRILDARLWNLRHHLGGRRLEDLDHPAASRGWARSAASRGWARSAASRGWARSAASRGWARSAASRAGAPARPRVRASSTRDPTTRLRSSSSGCQSTPTAKSLSGSSIASTRPSSECPLATTPSPSSSTPWWCADFTSVLAAPTTRAASEPGSSRTP